MNILNKDEGFQNLREDYPRTDTEVLADFYIKNDFNMKKTITDLYQKLRLMPTDKDGSDYEARKSSNKVQEFQSDQDEDVKEDHSSDNDDSDSDSDNDEES